MNVAVWPGTVLVNGEIVGSWRRSKRKVTVSSWTRLSTLEREAIVAEAKSFAIEERHVEVS